MPHELRAAAVILCAGGFQANPEMRARYLGQGWDMVRIRGVPFNTGDGLRMAMDIGAMVAGAIVTGLLARSRGGAIRVMAWVGLVFGLVTAPSPIVVTLFGMTTLLIADDSNA